MSTETRWLSGEERTAWLQLSAVLELRPGALVSQLRRDADLTLFQYQVLATLSQAPERTLRMSTLAARTDATLSRLSHVVSRLADSGLVERFPCPRDARATNIQLTATGSARAREAAPGHVSAVREHVLDVLTPDQLGQLVTISAALLTRLKSPAATATPTDGEEVNEATMLTQRFSGPVKAPPDITPATIAASLLDEVRTQRCAPGRPAGDRGPGRRLR